MDGLNERPLRGLGKSEANWDLLRLIYREAMGIKPPEPKPVVFLDFDYTAAEQRIQASLYMQREAILDFAKIAEGMKGRTITARLPRLPERPLLNLPRVTEEKIMKSPEMQKFVDNLQAVITGGDTTNQAVFENRCIKPPVGCGELLLQRNPFPSEVYEREYRITGMCAACQDKFEAEGEDYYPQTDPKG